MMSTQSFQARQTIKKQKRAGTLINACGKSAAKTAIFLDNGTVISSPLTVTRLLTAIEKHTARAYGSPSVKDQHNKLRVYESNIQQTQEYEDSIKKRAEQEYKRAIVRSVMNELDDQLIQDSDIELDPDLINFDVEVDIEENDEQSEQD